MVEDKVPKETPVGMLIEELKEKLKILEELHAKDMAILNRILSTYEDEISSVKNLLFDLSYKIKQLQSLSNLSTEQ
jgi:hypothetical protein